MNYLKTEYELGYTPANLRKLLGKHKMKQSEAREVIGKSRNTFSRYLYESDNPNHVSMKHGDWLALLDYIRAKGDGDL